MLTQQCHYPVHCFLTTFLRGGFSDHLFLTTFFWPLFGGAFQAFTESGPLIVADADEQIPVLQFVSLAHDKVAEEALERFEVAVVALKRVLVIGPDKCVPEEP